MPDIIFKADQGAGVRKIIRIMQGDKRSHVIRFVVPRYDSGVDLSPLTWYIKLIGTEGTPDIALPSALYEVTSEDIRVRWTVQGVSTEKVGSVKFQLYGCGKDAEGHVISWTSGAGEIEVTENIGYEVSEEQEEQLDSLDQLIVFVQGELNNVIQAGNDAAAAAVRAEAAAVGAVDATAAANRANAAAERAEFASAIAEVKANALSATAAGNPVQFPPDEHSIIKPVLTLLPVQSGSGEPSPDNIRPITGRTGAGLVRCGKNLVRNTLSTHSKDGITYTANDDGSIRFSGTATKDIPFFLNIPASLKPGTYVISGGLTHAGLQFRKDNADGSYGYHTTNTGTSSVFTIDGTETGYACYFYIRAGLTVDGTAYPQIELGSTATPFEPYQGDTYTLDFGQTVYGGKVDVNKGELVVDRGLLTLDGTESWGASTTNPCTYYIAQSNNYELLGNVYDGNFFDEYFHTCSHYTAGAYVASVPNNACFIYSGSGGKTIVFRDARFTTVDAWKEYISGQKIHSGTPVQIAYKLANPITISLTPQQITALAGVNTVYGDADEITVHYNKSLNAAFEELKNAILAMGGNV